MRKLTLAATAAASAVAAPAFAADLSVSVEIPRLSVAAYHRPYVAVWIERPDNTAVRTLDHPGPQGDDDGGQQQACRPLRRLSN